MNKGQGAAGGTVLTAKPVDGAPKPTDECRSDGGCDRSATLKLLTKKLVGRVLNASPPRVQQTPIWGIIASENTDFNCHLDQ